MNYLKKNGLGFRRRFDLSQLLKDDDGQRPITKAHLVELKIHVLKETFF